MLSKNSKWYAAALVLIGCVVGVAVVSAGTAAVHAFGSTQFCGTFCHSMDAAYASYQKGMHFKTKSGATAGCSDCHLKYESQHSITQPQVVGLLWHKASSSMSSMWGQIRGTMNTPEKQIAMREELGAKYTEWQKSIGFGNCRGCHDLSKFADNPAKPMIPMMHRGMAENPKADCLGCHKTAGHKYN